MNLGIFLSPGDSLTNLANSGQADRFIKFFIKPYSKQFNMVYIFSYEDEQWELPDNVILVLNKNKIHRFVYGLFLPIFQFSQINRCDVIRGFGLASSISSFLLWKPFVFNWAYDYIEFVKTDHKYIYIPFYYLLEKLAFINAKKVLIATKQKYQILSGSKFIYFPNGVDLLLFKAKFNKQTRLLFIG